MQRNMHWYIGLDGLVHSKLHADRNLLLHFLFRCRHHLMLDLLLDYMLLNGHHRHLYLLLQNSLFDHGDDLFNDDLSDHFHVLFDDLDDLVGHQSLDLLFNNYRLLDLNLSCLFLDHADTSGCRLLGGTHACRCPRWNLNVERHGLHRLVQMKNLRIFVDHLVNDRDVRLLLGLERMLVNDLLYHDVLVFNSRHLDHLFDFHDAWNFDNFLDHRNLGHLHNHLFNFVDRHYDFIVDINRLRHLNDLFHFLLQVGNVVVVAPIWFLSRLAVEIYFVEGVPVDLHYLFHFY
mmetsp:Transcript_41776/g.75010  ORF Transcript_41776/g.75010 Transcript_41776/m.75010 type:complete len:289 (+) Transcript_41776:240-1106(+)